MLFKHAEMVSVAVALFNINETVQLLFSPVVKCSQSPLNYGESAPRPSTSVEPRQCFFNERTMERCRCAVSESTRSDDLVNHA